MIKEILVKFNYVDIIVLGHNNCVRTYKQCITLLSVFKDIDAINLDYDLGGEETGLDILIYMKQNNIKV